VGVLRDAQIFFVDMPKYFSVGVVMCYLEYHGFGFTVEIFNDKQFFVVLRIDELHDFVSGGFAIVAQRGERFVRGV